MKIVFIGSGNVATHMAVALKKANNEIVQIYSRTLQNAQHLAHRVGAQAISEIDHLFLNADLYIFSISDDALPLMVKQMPTTTGIWVHTAGSISMDTFSGVIYPLQTFSKNKELNFSEIPLFIEGNSPEIEFQLTKLAKTISDDVRPLNSEQRKHLHLAAVFANNFSNHMYTLSNEILKQNEIPFDVLKPLIRETAAKVMEMDPSDAQTGPAVRLDVNVINRHLDLIHRDEIKNIYEQISRSINKSLRLR